ncbi:alpha/beta fold hydrolase [Pelodictyon luteolum]|uniref:3-oxoadipate enol-lactonase, putative n=1 Tax=Chlorobium luteolum (strain DSM 273 / BCRC 81028 / 2530) TaxID=319225 RepID=Q3B658_CHLL3|nr:alpha/beta fold hydrolase [Pelodictyon luteolum]ABB23173.1 3-oxoadipate enol-lactonase, putative [Pelodictyon luteolum DSM 273]
MLSWTGVNTEHDGTDRKSVLLLHAFPLSGAMWHPQLRALDEKGYRAVAPNAWGIEGSPERTGWTFDDYADELVRLMDSLKISDATVLGLSMGGYQAFALEKRHPERVRSLVLADTRPEADAPGAAAARADFIAGVAERGAEEAVKRMVPNYFTKEAPKRLQQEAAAMIKAQPPGAIISAMRAIMQRSDSTAMQSSISCPTMVICGEHDTLTPPETARAMALAIPGATLEIIAEAGHISNLEQPEAFNKALFGHLTGLTR